MSNVQVLAKIGIVGLLGYAVFLALKPTVNKDDPVTTQPKTLLPINYKDPRYNPNPTPNQLGSPLTTVFGKKGYGDIFF